MKSCRRVQLLNWDLTDIILRSEGTRRKQVFEFEPQLSPNCLLVSCRWTSSPLTRLSGWTLPRWWAPGGQNRTWAGAWSPRRWSCVPGTVVLGPPNSATGRSAGRTAASWAAGRRCSTPAATAPTAAATHSAAPASLWSQEGAITAITGWTSLYRQGETQTIKVNLQKRRILTSLEASSQDYFYCRSIKNDSSKFLKCQEGVTMHTLSLQATKCVKGRRKGETEWDKRDFKLHKRE